MDAGQATGEKGAVQESARGRRSTHSTHHREREILRLKLCLSLVSVSCQLASINRGSGANRRRRGSSEISTSGQQGGEFDRRSGLAVQGAGYDVCSTAANRRSTGRASVEGGVWLEAVGATWAPRGRWDVLYTIMRAVRGHKSWGVACPDRDPEARGTAVCDFRVVDVIL
jgi:hypothetical protein